MSLLFTQTQQLNWRLVIAGYVLTTFPKPPVEINLVPRWSFPRWTEWLFHQPDYCIISQRIIWVRPLLFFFFPSEVICSAKIGAHIMQTGRENVIHVSLFCSNNLRGCFTRGAKREHVPVSVMCVSPLAAYYPFCCRINGAIDQQQTCAEQLITHLQQGSAATARLITDAWLGRVAEEPSLTPFYSDSLTLIGEGAAVGNPAEAGDRFNKAET